jgi:hypothetical protein
VFLLFLFTFFFFFLLFLFLLFLLLSTFLPRVTLGRLTVPLGNFNWICTDCSMMYSFLFGSPLLYYCSGISSYSFITPVFFSRSSVVVKAPCYKLEGCGIDNR